ncbi:MULTISPECIES: hypothetical protein [unclassified Arsenophonus]|uniref:hypothetical protein n=1 Tax=unclassified Arsenophonus TaxID=2627083 RepID=UPI002855A754|nr:hypothetical protein [Arsenophonus sp.]MDR5610802.1 hypothetical protein [Arsenophonus sp.]MDR5614740.1 hypothetical protein [Arsenophonus sp.]
MKLLFKTFTIVSLLGFSHFSLAIDNPTKSQFTLLCGTDQFGRDVCLNQNGQFVPVPESMPKL